uniref:Putative ovule protein n=1 Tax=Solanum chacoense TaxID=4108 RepID=A0A0V0H291_SOLCH
MMKMVRSFFCGHEPSRYITCTNLILINKKGISTFSDLRPISLDNFTAKRLVHLLPDLISPQQAGFLKGRSIVENILLV